MSQQKMFSFFTFFPQQLFFLFPMAQPTGSVTNLFDGLYPNAPEYDLATLLQKGIATFDRDTNTLHIGSRKPTPTVSYSLKDNNMNIAFYGSGTCCLLRAGSLLVVYSKDFKLVRTPVASLKSIIDNQDGFVLHRVSGRDMRRKALESEGGQKRKRLREQEHAEHLYE